MKKNSEYSKLLIFFTVFAFFGSFSGSILPVHFLDSGVSLLEMSIARILPWVVQMFALLSMRRLPVKRSLVIGVSLVMLQVLLVMKIETIWQFYLSSALFGLHVHFFYTTYNTIHFKNTQQEHNGFSSGIMFTIFAVIAFITPILAGLIANYNLMYVWIISGILFLVTLGTLFPLENGLVTFKIKESWHEIKSLRTLVILEGFAGSAHSVLIPIYTLQFINTIIGFGGFLAYIGLAGGIGNILFAKFTDKIQKRSVFLYPTSILLAVCTFLYPFGVNNFTFWIILTGLMSMLMPVFNTLCLALVTDKKVDIMKAVPGREVALGFGRIVGCGVIVVSFIYEPQPHYIFYILGFGTLLLPIVLWIKSQFLKSQSYL